MHLRVWTVDRTLFQSFTNDKAINPLKNHKIRPTSSTQKPVHLMYASTGGESAMGVEASIRSVMQHTSEPVVFHYVGDSPLSSPDMSQVKFYNLTKVAKKYKLKYYTNPHERSEGGYQGINTNLANYARFAMDSLLKKVSKAMWLDADTIVRCDVVPMVRNALCNETSHNIIAAVPGERKPRGFPKEVRKQYNLSLSFNAGVYVVDLNKWRSENMSSKIRAIALMNREQKIYDLGSQAPLALAVGDRFEHLPWIWNAKVGNFNRTDRLANAEEACIVHWNGPTKPWDKDGIHSDLWTSYASKEPHPR